MSDPALRVESAAINTYRTAAEAEALDLLRVLDATHRLDENSPHRFTGSPARCYKCGKSE